MRLHPDIERAYKVLDGEELSEAEALTLTGISGCDILDLVSLANKVRDKFAPEIVPCSIINAKSGVCSQNCKFCAQSGFHSTGIETYELLEPEKIIAGARAVYNQGVRTYGIVTSGLGYEETDPEFLRILECMDALKKEFPDLHICVSLGILTENAARLLAEHGAYRYNMNLQTNPERYAELISDTHSIVKKIQTIRSLQKYGVTICCGGIFGLGENWNDRIKMAQACRDLNVDGIPLNVLLPIPGTPLEKRPIMEPSEVAKAFAIFRLMNPAKMIKFAAGRETAMKDFQGLLMLGGMNSMITGGYLTTRGRSVEEDRVFLAHLALFTDHAKH
ncbi:MAG: Biotin synthase [Lentisphaerae bacterium ADurb.Bin242]|nr:MAG: Biotin synthase [Lentisphaerae bacterium ADurb.Bin242]